MGELQVLGSFFFTYFHPLAEHNGNVSCFHPCNNFKYRRSIFPVLGNYDWLVVFAEYSYCNSLWFLPYFSCLKQTFLLSYFRPFYVNGNICVVRPIGSRSLTDRQPLTVSLLPPEVAVIIVSGICIIRRLRRAVCTLPPLSVSVPR